MAESGTKPNSSDSGFSHCLAPAPTRSLSPAKRFQAAAVMPGTNNLFALIGVRDETVPSSFPSMKRLLNAISG